jgi:serine/threonine protein kinase
MPILAAGHAQEAADLVGKLLDPNPQTRMKMKVAMKHSWF